MAVKAVAARPVQVWRGTARQGLAWRGGHCQKWPPCRLTKTREQKVTNQQLVEILRGLEDQEGRLTPETVVAAAPQRHLLHPRFEWDDSKAAHEHRIDTARGLIRVVYMAVRHEKTVWRVPVYTRDPSMASDVQGYRATMRVRDEPDEAHAALAMEMARVASILVRARGMAMALGLDGAIDAIDAQVAEFVSELHRRRAEDRPEDEDRPEA